MKKERIKYLNACKIKDNKYVIYWMQASQRVSYNHALAYAITKANDLNKPLLVYFGLTTNFPDANLRHYTFMLDGLKEVKKELNEMGIKFIIMNNSPIEGIMKLSKLASLIITDRGYLKIERSWRDTVSSIITVPLIQVESNVMVPIEEVSLKEEYAAMTIRKKINNLIDYYADDFKMEEVVLKSNLDTLDYEEVDLNNIDSLGIDSSVLPSTYYYGGITNARKLLSDFITNKLNDYESLSNHPELDYQSHLSPYLHFGQISPLEIYLKVKDLDSKSYLEELIVRRELAINFIYYNKNYDNYKCLPDWSIKTITKHLLDKRDYTYTLSDLEMAKTHEIYWNACQKELLITGKMHGYMRMYWGKKVIEWSINPEVAYNNLIYLNNKYSLDGRDANGYAGIAWCFGKHDRPWQERPIFGMVRYMNADGLKRKFDIDKYLRKWL